MTKSKIEWTEETWNPLTGCTKISPGCANCYAEKMSLRLKAMGSPNYSNGFELTLHDDSLSIPFNWKKPRMVFVNSMSDLFHKDVPDDFIIKTFKVMNILHQHTFQILTKRSHRLAEMVSILKFTPNIWMGVSVENADYCYRIKNLAKTNACIKFVSFEPLIGPVGNFFADELDWVIVGGESGPKSREMQKEWVNSIKTTCVEMKIPFFFKQWGGTNKKKAGRILDGQIWSQFPSK